MHEHVCVYLCVYTLYVCVYQCVCILYVCVCVYPYVHTCVCISMRVHMVLLTRNDVTAFTVSSSSSRTAAQPVQIR